MRKGWVLGEFVDGEFVDEEVYGERWFRGLNGWVSGIREGGKF